MNSQIGALRSAGPTAIQLRRASS